MKARIMAIAMTIVVAGALLAGVGADAPAAHAATPSPQEVVAYKVALNAPLTPTDAYVFFLMVRSVVPATEVTDAQINDAVTQYNAGKPDLLKQLPTNRTSPPDGGSANVPVSGETAPAPATTAGLPSCPAPTTHYFGFTTKWYNVVGATLFWTRFDVAWDTYCGAVITKVWYTRFTYSTTTLGNVTGWDFKGIQFDEHWLFAWNGYNPGGFHKYFGGQWKQCLTFLLTVCAWTSNFKHHVDVFADGWACAEGTGFSRRTCWPR